MNIIKTKAISFLIVLALLFPINGLSKNMPGGSDWKTSNNGLFAGIITDIAIDPSEHMIWASTIRGGVYISPITNFQWKRNNKGLNNLFVHCLHFHEGTLFAGTDDFLFRWDSNEDNWIPTNENLKQIKVNNIYSLSNNVILTATNKGIYRSDDKGITWISRTTGANIYDVLTFTSYDEPSQTIFAVATGRVLLKSSNSGLSWEKDINAIIPTEFKKILIDRNNHNKWYAATIQQGFMISENSGRSWQHQNTNLNNLYISDIIQDEHSNQLWISTYDGIYYTNTSAIIWDNYGLVPFNSQINTFKINSKMKLVFIGTQGNGVLYSSLDSPNWQFIHNGMDNVHIRNFMISTTSNDIFVGTWGAGVFRSSDNGITWEQINNGITNPYILCMADNKKGQLFVGTFNGGLFTTRNNGNSWEIITAATFYSNYVYSVAIDPRDQHRIYVGTHDGIFRSVNNGESWFRIGPGSPDNPAGDILHISIDPANSKHIIASTNATGIHISKDGGDSWTLSNAGLINRHITKTLFNPNNSNIIYAATFGSGIYQSLDQGASWKEFNRELSDLMVYDIIIERHHADIIYCATENGVFYNTIKENQWKPIGTKLNRKSVRSLIVDTNNYFYMAGTYGSGAYILKESLRPPTPVYPKTNEELIPTTILFQWKLQDIATSNISNIKLILIISENNDFSNTIISKQFSIHTTTYQTDDIFKPHHTYYWKVGIAENDNEEPSWSEVAIFHTITLMVLKVGEPLMTVNGIQQEIDPGRTTLPIIKNNRTFLPIRSIVENLGARIEWNPSTRTVSIFFLETLIELTIDKAEAIVNGNFVSIDPNDPKLAPFIHNERTMLPLRFVAETLNVRVEWEGTSQTITLIYPDKK